MDIEIIIFENDQYTDYAFENELKLELEKINRSIISLNSKQQRQRIGFRKKDMRIINVTIDGEEIEDPDEFNDTIANAVVQTTNRLLLELYSL
ncbi:hypothetical protein [Oceanobacillus kapialis]|uniref:Uncharacterized protein n=1 Tax=Oceanobacillus kapialis TaxID=481353 RepID=A0ABW5Q227_9BACI